jgi:ankyrin repeat protein
MQPEFERAARNGDTGLIESLLNSGAPIDSRDRHGQTALIIASHGGHLAVVECLLRDGAQPDTTAKYGLSALMLAIVAGIPRQKRVRSRPAGWNDNARQGNRGTRERQRMTSPMEAAAPQSGQLDDSGRVIVEGLRPR